MKRFLAIAALAAVCSVLSGCGCSKEKDVPETPEERMQDAAYTNRLVKITDSQQAVAAKAAAIRAEIAKLGEGAAAKPGYADLTNRLARCEAELRMLQKTARDTVRARLLKNVREKGGLKK